MVYGYIANITLFSRGYECLPKRLIYFLCVFPLFVFLYTTIRQNKRSIYNSTFIFVALYNAFSKIQYLLQSYSYIVKIHIYSILLKGDIDASI